MTLLDAAYLSAGDALKLFKARKLSPVELLEMQIARAERLNPQIKAFGDTYFDEALAHARISEARYARGGLRARPLEGLTLAVKDDTTIAGKRTTMGSLLKTEDIGTATDAAVARLEKAGAIVHARTLTPEFCLVGVTHSRLWGVSRNPHNHEFTPGGSSGGSGAALAAGFTTLATGTDIGGSIRIPASACGIAGYLAPQGRIPDTTSYSLDWNSRVGPMARSAADCALMFNVMNGPHPLDIVSLRQRLRVLPALRDIKGWRIAYSLDFGYKTLDPDVRGNTLKALDVFRSLGCKVDEVKVPWTQSLERIRRDYLYVLWGKRMAPLLVFKRDQLSDYTIKYVEASVATPIGALHEGIDAIHAIYASFGPMMEKHDIFICPTLAIPAAKAEHDAFDAGFTIDGVPADPRSGWIMTYPFNMLGRLPVMSVPSGRARNDVPTGIQIAGKSFDDLSVFRAAMNFERVLGFDVSRGLI